MLYAVILDRLEGRRLPAQLMSIPIVKVKLEKARLNESAVGDLA